MTVSFLLDATTPALLPGKLIRKNKLQIKDTFVKLGVKFSEIRFADMKWKEGIERERREGYFSQLPKALS
jgi:hypothetical protein